MSSAGLLSPWRVAAEMIRWELVSQDDPGDRVDLIANEGWTDSLVIQPDGRFTESITTPGGGSGPMTGTVAIDGSNLVFDFGGQPERFAFTLSGNTLTLKWSGWFWGFDRDGTLDPGDATEVMVRE